MDFGGNLAAVSPCYRNLLFGAGVGAFVGFVGGGVDATTSALRVSPRPAGRDLARVALNAAASNAVGTLAVFGAYHACKCALRTAPATAAFTDVQTAIVSAGVAVTTSALVRPRPRASIWALLLIMDNLHFVMPART